MIRREFSFPSATGVCTVSACAYLPETGFHYRQREGSIMSARNDKRIVQIFNVLAMVRENFRREGLYEKFLTELEYLHIEHLRLYGMFRFCAVLALCCFLWLRLFRFFPLWYDSRNLDFLLRLGLQRYRNTSVILFLIIQKSLIDALCQTVYTI